MTQSVGQPTYEQLKAQLATLEKKIANQAAIGTSMRISEKGGVSVYGLGRFPVTLYKSQWDKLIALAPEITKFMAANEDKLAVKGEVVADTTPATPAATK